MAGENPYINLSLEQLQALVRNADTNVAGKNTLLYNNDLVLVDGNEMRAWRFAESIGANHSNNLMPHIITVSFPV